MNLQDIDWQQALRYAFPALTFIVGYLIGRGGNSSRGLHASAKAIRQHGQS